MEYLKSNCSDIKEVMIGSVPVVIIEPKEETNKTLVFYHGWGSDNERQIFRGNIFAAYGYRVILPEARYHGDRNVEKLDHDDKFV